MDTPETTLPPEPQQPDSQLHWPTAQVDGRIVKGMSELREGLTALHLAGGGTIEIAAPFNDVRTKVNTWRVNWGNWELAHSEWAQAKWRVEDDAAHASTPDSGPTAKPYDCGDINVRGPDGWDLLWEGIGVGLGAAVEPALRAAGRWATGPARDRITALGVAPEALAHLDELLAADSAPKADDVIAALEAVVRGDDPTLAFEVGRHFADQDYIVVISPREFGLFRRQAPAEGGAGDEAPAEGGAGDQVPAEGGAGDEAPTEAAPTVTITVTPAAPAVVADASADAGETGEGVSP